MSTVAEIEAAISNLPPHDFAQVRNWLLERDNLLWDKQIEENAATGRLDHVIKEIENDIAAGRTKPLNEVIDGS
ncbi:MAG TPA: hypothetical protein VGZ93_00820 [Candidatus Methylacidiphilales bacterium]|nr:hypothetical protein [Candidatus Methylacidiphilales bacterium]